MKTLYDFIYNLVNKYWQKYDKDIIGAGFSRATSYDINKEIMVYIKDNLPYKYDYEEYKNDDDEYVKFATQQEIVKSFIEELNHLNIDYNIPKRFKQHYSQRD